MNLHSEGFLSACYFTTMIGIFVVGLAAAYFASFINFWLFIPITGATIFLTIWSSDSIAGYFVKKIEYKY